MYTHLAGLTFTTRAGAASSSQYIEVYLEDSFISRHANETEATQAMIRHAQNLPPGDYEYEFRMPSKFVGVLLKPVEV